MEYPIRAEFGGRVTPPPPKKEAWHMFMSEFIEMQVLSQLEVCWMAGMM